ncbi:MAG TPA: cupin domain-containing protein [Solirubrobacteraceae bacterium]|nr:cupin domain-containing protein [Solirubrobacteraceae bacterium]
MSGYVLRQIDELASIHGGLVKLAGAELGVASFGMQVLDLPPGFDAYPEHDHSDSGQEEVYLALRGSVEFEVDGERGTLEPGAILRVAATARRSLRPGADGARVLALGGTPGALYERPADFEVAVSS